MKLGRYELCLCTSGRELTYPDVLAKLVVIYFLFITYLTLESSPRTDGEITDESIASRVEQFTFLVRIRAPRKVVLLNNVNCTVG